MARNEIAAWTAFLFIAAPPAWFIHDHPCGLDSAATYVISVAYVAAAFAVVMLAGRARRVWGWRRAMRGIPKSDRMRRRYTVQGAGGGSWGVYDSALSRFTRVYRGDAARQHATDRHRSLTGGAR
jgi:hypothetical protein